MSEISIDTDSLRNDVIPSINYGKSYLNEASGYVKEIIAKGLELGKDISEVDKQITELAEELGVTKEELLETCEDFEDAEEKNKSITNKLTSSITVPEFELPETDEEIITVPEFELPETDEEEITLPKFDLSEVEKNIEDVEIDENKSTITTPSSELLTEEEAMIQEMVNLGMIPEEMPKSLEETLFDTFAEQTCTAVADIVNISIRRHIGFIKRNRKCWRCNCSRIFITYM